MQTLSSMRRSGVNQKHVVSIWWVLFLAIYQIFTSLYIVLSPLIGYFFCYLVLLSNEEDRTHEEQTATKYLIFLYLVFTDLNKGFYLFSSLIFFFLFKHLLAEWLQTSFKCKKCILFAFVAFGYIGTYAINNLMAYMLQKDFFLFSWEYGLYIIIDSIVAFILFRDKII